VQLKVRLKTVSMDAVLFCVLQRSCASPVGYYQNFVLYYLKKCRKRANSRNKKTVEIARKVKKICAKISVCPSSGLYDHKTDML